MVGGGVAAALGSRLRRGSQPAGAARHIVAQQLLALVLQERRLVRADLPGWLGGLAEVAGADQVLAYLHKEGFLICDQGLVSIGPSAERDFGRRFFRDLTSAFTSEAALTAIWGREVIGELSALALAARPAGGLQVVLLGGRSWAVKHVDWRARRVSLEPSDIAGSTRWAGRGRVMSHALARAHHDVLAGHQPDAQLSHRASDMLAELRGEQRFVTAGPDFHTYLVRRAADPPVWWTFAGSQANAGLAAGLTGLADPASSVSGLRLRLRADVTAGELKRTITSNRDRLVHAEPVVDSRAVTALKFSSAVPRSLAVETLVQRLSEPSAIRATIDAGISVSMLTDPKQ